MRLNKHKAQNMYTKKHKLKYQTSPHVHANMCMSCIYVWYTYGEVSQQNTIQHTHTHTLTLPVLGVSNDTSSLPSEWNRCRRVKSNKMMIFCCIMVIVVFAFIMALLVCVASFLFFSFLRLGLDVGRSRIPCFLIIVGPDRIGRSDLTLYC
jgi:hypothetical protein